VLMFCWPHTRVVLMDASERRTTFLSETVSTWPDLSNVEVIRARAEELGRLGGMREQFQAVTSRSFGIPSAVAECGSSFLEPEGRMVVSEPPDSLADERWPAEGLLPLNLVRLSSARVSDRFGYQVLGKTGVLDDRYPRRVGIPVKRPLF